MSLFETLTDQSWRESILRSRAEPNLVLQQINELAMTNYTVTMDDGHKITVKAWSAADAIQSGLTKHIGHRVSACRSGDMSTGAMEGHINYEIPNHEPVMETKSREKREAKVETEENRRERERPAPWLEDWLAKQKSKSGG